MSTGIHGFTLGFKKKKKKKSLLSVKGGVCHAVSRILSLTVPRCEARTLVRGQLVNANTPLSPPAFCRVPPRSTDTSVNDNREKEVLASVVGGPDIP